MAYPSVYDPANKSSSSSSSTKQDVPDPDWWSKNIGRDAKAFNDAKNVPLPDEKQESLRPREQFERAVQQKVLPLLHQMVAGCACLAWAPPGYVRSDFARLQVGI